MNNNNGKSLQEIIIGRLDLSREMTEEEIRELIDEQIREQEAQSGGDGQRAASAGNFSFDQTAWNFTGIN